MKKLNKILSVIMIVLMLVCVSSNVFAGTINIDDIKSNETVGGTTEMTKIGSTIITFVTNIGIILAVVVIAIIGVKYMLGSVEEKAEYKKTMMPYLVGAILIFGASTIAKMVTSINF